MTPLEKGESRVSQVGQLAAAESKMLTALVSAPAGGIASRVLARAAGGNVTLFAFDAGQELSEHSTPLEALAVVVDGLIDLTVGGVLVPAQPGSITRLPANVPHAVRAHEASRMLLIMLREQ
jgi:quercetin dioxygenase-like cupin family protein